MINYINQTGCHDCAHVFVRSEHDDLDRFYCTRNAPPRPPCMSVGMGEAGNITTENFKAWNEWSGNRQVEPFGTCDAYQNREDGTVDV